MSCDCQTIPDTLYLDQAPRGWFRPMKAQSRAQWATLYRCPHCGQHWAIDEQRRAEPRVATRTAATRHWHAASDAERKRLLSSARGGTTDTPCIWAGCPAPTVRETIYCIDHLYETGARI